MKEHSDCEMYRKQINYLEGKCAFLTKRLEEVLLSVQQETRGQHFVARSVVDTGELARMREENERLKRSISILRNSVSWRVTKPLRLLNIPLIDRWVLKKATQD